MSRKDLKRLAVRTIQTTRPSPMLVALAVIAYSWIITILSQRIGGQPVYVDMDALMSADAANAVVVDWSNVAPASSAILLAFEIMSMFLDIGFLRYCLNAARRLECRLSDLLAGFEFPFRAIVLWLLTRVVICLLSLLLVIPGLIALYAYAMAPRLLCDHPDWSPIRCMKESRRLMRGHKWEYFILQLSFLGWILLTLIPVFSIFVNPYITLTETEYYLRLIGEKRDAPASPETDERPPWEY